MASIKTLLAFLATAFCLLTSALPLTSEPGQNDIILSVLSHDTFISEATCSFGEATLCLHSIIKDLTQTFLATYDEDPPLPVEKRGVESDHTSLTGIRRARAFDQSSSLHPLNKRDARTSAGGFVGTFYWLALSSAAYTAFDKSPARIDRITEMLTQYVLEFNATELCVDFGAGISGGDIIANGVLTFGWGREAFYYADPGLLERRLEGSCGIGEMRKFGTYYWQVVLE